MRTILHDRGLDHTVEAAVSFLDGLRRTVVVLREGAYRERRDDALARIGAQGS